MGNQPSLQPASRRKKLKKGASSKRSNRKKDDVQESLIRVGSQLWSISEHEGENGDGSRRATNYDHVRKAVLYNLSKAGTLDADKGVPGVVGFRNLGNTCYINSALQCLSNTIPLTEYFLGYDYKEEINENNPLGSGGELVTAYAELIKKIWLKPAKSKTERRVLVTKGFQRKVTNFAPQFKGHAQHDTHEFLATLLDGVHEDLNRCLVKPYIEEKDIDSSLHNEDEAINSWENYLKRNKSVIVDIFQGQLRNTCKCHDCGHKNIRFESFMYLSLPISEECSTVEDCLDNFTKEEELTGDNQWYCGACKKHVDAVKKTDIWVLPPILIVHLKRFKFGDDESAGEKIDAELEYPISGWDVSDYLKSEGGGLTVYELYASANHWGNLDSGHYTSYALNQFDKQWYEFDDNGNEVIDLDETFESSSAPYVLFFSRAATVSADSGSSINRQSVTLPNLWPHSQERQGAGDIQKKTAGRGGKKKKKGQVVTGGLATLDEEGENGEAVTPTKKKKKGKLKKGKSSKSVGKKKRKKNGDATEIAVKRATSHEHIKEVVMHNFADNGCLEDKGGAPAGVIGLRNLGNTCYLNSALQCLSNTIPLTEYFLGYDYRSDINSDNIDGTGGEFVIAYAELMQKIWLKTAAKRRVVVCQGFKKILAKHATQFKGSRQHDSHEAIAMLLDGIHEDLNQCDEKSLVEIQDHDGTGDDDDATATWEGYLKQNKSFIVDTFQGQLRNTCQCRECGFKNVRFESFMYLSVPITEDCKSLDDCLDLIVQEEELNGDNQWYCGKCEKLTDATKKIDLWTLPEILIVQIMRFRFDSYDEEGAKVDIPLKYPVSRWNLSQRVQSEEVQRTSYDLYATSNHKGADLDSGHHTTYALNRFDRDWYEFDDNDYEVIDPDEKFESNGSPYVLFYNRSDDSGGPTPGMRQSMGLTNRPLEPTQHMERMSTKPANGLVPPPLASRRSSDGLSTGLKMPARSERKSVFHKVVEYDDDFDNTNEDEDEGSNDDERQSRRN